MSRIAVVGGGITGLAAAHRLTELEAGCEFVLFEAAERLGGVLVSESVDGFCIEWGPDSMLTQIPWGVDLCRRIGFVDELIGTNPEHRQTWIVRSGRLVPLPEGLAIMAPSRIWPTARSPILSILGKLRLGWELFVPQRTGGEDESLADFACRRVGREAFERLVQPLVSGIYMADPKRLSIQAALPRFVDMESQHGSLIRAARKAAKQAKTKPANKTPSDIPTTMFAAPRAGMGSLAQALAERLPRESIRLQSAITKLRRKEEGGWRLSGEHNSAEFAEDFDAVVLTTSSQHAAGLLGEINEPLSRELAEIEHSGCIVVSLAFARKDINHPLDGYGFVVPQVENRDIIACTFSSVKYAGRAPNGQVLLRAYLGGATRTDQMELDEEAARNVVLRELNDLLGIKGQPTLTRVVRQRNVMPQYHVGHLEKVTRIEAAVAELSGLELAGNSYRGVGIPHCIHAGEQAAESAAKAITVTT